MVRFRGAAVGMVLGGRLMTILYVPLTIAHGPTSFNRGGEVLGADMHVWGFLLGVVPCLMLGLTLWRLRETASGARAITRKAWTVVSVLLLLSAAQDLLPRTRSAVPLLRHGPGVAGRRRDASIPRIR